MLLTRLRVLALVALALPVATPALAETAESPGPVEAAPVDDLVADDPALFGPVTGASHAGPAALMLTPGGATSGLGLVFPGGFGRWEIHANGFVYRCTIVGSSGAGAGIVQPAGLLEPIARPACSGKRISDLQYDVTMGPHAAVGVTMSFRGSITTAPMPL